ncbi:MAG: elongation factor Ts, partial [Coxiellaceae bacterium]|nr:elongation factor Ts [Coxiellaceae bacterium]
KSGQAKAAKRAARTAAEGVVLIASSSDNKKAYMVEINCETDFVARDENFRGFSENLVQRGLQTEAEGIDALLASPEKEGASKTLEEARAELVAKIGENVQLRRFAMEASSGTVGSYQHGDRIGVIVALDKDEPELAKDVAMHVAATNPQAISAEGVSSELIEKEKEIFVSQAKDSGKPDEIIEKMVLGRISKFLKEICLVDQAFIKDPDQTVGALLKASGANVVSFVRFEVGEGIEKETVDFAEEVQAQLKGNE